MKRNTSLTLGEVIRNLKNDCQGRAEFVQFGIDFMNANPEIVSILLYGLEQNYSEKNQQIVSQYVYTISYDTTHFLSGDFSFIEHSISTDLSQRLKVVVNCDANNLSNDSLTITVFIRTFPANKG